MVDFMPFSRDLSQEQLIGCVIACEFVTLSKACLASEAFYFVKLIAGISLSSRGDTTNTNLQNMEPVTDADEEQVPEDLGKLTVVDKARTGRVSQKIAIYFYAPNMFKAFNF